MKQIKNTKRTMGFTIIELMVVMVIVGLVVTLAMPSFTNLNQGSQMTAIANELIGVFNRARGEAIRRGQAVEVTSVNGNWSNGYKIWVDIDQDGVLDAGTGDANELIYLQSSFDSGITFTFDSQVTKIAFLPNGFSTLTATYTITICSNESASVNGKDIMILVSGRTKVKDNECN
jgi:type IV fimbrial biogenesis protein FimT